MELWSMGKDGKSKRSILFRLACWIFVFHFFFFLFVKWQAFKFWRVVIALAIDLFFVSDLELIEFNFFKYNFLNRILEFLFIVTCRCAFALNYTLFFKEFLAHIKFWHSFYFSVDNSFILLTISSFGPICQRVYNTLVDLDEEKNINSYNNDSWRYENTILISLNILTILLVVVFFLW